MRTRDIQVDAIIARARRHYEAKAYDAALGAAREALGLLEKMIGGLGETAAGTARGKYQRVFALGTLSAARLGRADDVLHFMDSGRAGALLESLGGRDAMRWAELPDELHDLKGRAEAAQARAQRAYADALQTGLRKKTRAASKALDQARSDVEAVIGRIQREAKRQAGLLYPRATTMDELQLALRPSEALVAFALYDVWLVRLVVTPDDAKLLPLVKRPTVESHMGCVDCADQDADPKPHIAQLRRLLTAGIELGPDVRTVLVSPAGSLCYVPFQLVFDQTVVMMPSGTTHVLLREESFGNGSRVLGIGAPDYAGTSAGSRAAYFRGKQLPALPSAASEIRAVADERLIGQGATEEAFVAAVATNERWKAVHFACHGLLDADNPGRSALALTQTETEDGFFTGLEVFQTPIPTDLAVLSACETARGKLVAAEGLVGMARAFMYAGAPRIICSLWKVDDEATSALMKKFYALWNPSDEAAAKLSAAEALRRAQVHVASQEKWAHPYFWAAWQLWGLP